MALLGACGKATPEAELERLRNQAMAANAKAVAAHAGHDLAEPGRTLKVSGQLAHAGAPLEWPELDALATAHVRTTNPHNTTHLEQIIEYRGVPVSKLLDRFGAAPAATEATFVSIDGYRATIDLEDARRFPIALAVAADGAPIDRWHGGPMYLVFPHREHPESKRYSGRFWAFYVTDLIIGTEAATLSVGPRTFDRAALEALPPAELRGVATWKIGWPSTAVRLVGVRVDEVLRSAGISVPTNGRVIVRGKAAIHRDPKTPVELAAADVERCGFLLVMRWGRNERDEENVPARLGGPLALAVPPACAGRYGDRFWIPFVEELVIAREDEK
jgi:hypothetical protein